MYFSWPVGDRFQGPTSPREPRSVGTVEGEICEMWPELVRPAGFEPAAFGSGAQCAIQASYLHARWTSVREPPLALPILPTATAGERHAD